MAGQPLLIARHAETIFNRSRRMQGNGAHTPLTRDGIAQAEAMGEALRRHAETSGEWPLIAASPAGRTQQTAAIIAEHLGHAFFDIRLDPRLREIEIGDWEGRYYADIIAEQGEILDREHRLFRMPIAGGEHYRDVAERLRGWLAELPGDRPVLAVTHGITARVMRGMLVGGREYQGVHCAADVPQGSVVRVADGMEELLFVGSGASGPRAA